MQGRDDVGGFIENFAGDDRYIVDYLVQEVLQRQPDPIRAFLLETAILDRLSGPLCDAVTRTGDGQATLRSLEQGNVFVVPLDDRRTWYRYHHLFADVLRAHLSAQGPERVPELHRRASRWFEENDDRPEAIRHALAARDFATAAAIIEPVANDMLRARQEAPLRGWLEALPDEVLRLRPVLCASYVGALLQTGETPKVEGLLRNAERGLETAVLWDRKEPLTPGEAVYVDERQFRELPGMIALYRAGYSQVLGNLADTVTYARQALERMPPDFPLRGGAMALLGLALWSSGDLDEAYRT
jgi:LuxR family maltose regulon positive regulatory protein